MSAKKTGPGTYVGREAKAGAGGLLTIVAVVLAVVFLGPGLARGVGSAAVDAAGDAATDAANNSGDLATHLSPLTAAGDGPYGPGGRYPTAPPPTTAPQAKPTTAYTTPNPPAGDGVKGRIRAIEPGGKGYPGAPETAQPAPKADPRGGLPSLGGSGTGGVLGELPVIGGAIKAIGSGTAAKALAP